MAIFPSLTRRRFAYVFRILYNAHTKPFFFAKNHVKHMRSDSEKRYENVR